MDTLEKESMPRSEDHRFSTARVKITPKDFFLWAGAMVALYAGIFAFITLLFNYIDYSFPDPLRYYTDPYSSGMPYQMASLIVLAPLFLALMRIIRGEISRDATRGETWVRRWALYLTVFVAGATIVVDLIVLITRFLGGEELSTAFLLKVLVVLLVAGAGFLHFFSDLRGYWGRNPEKAKMVNWSVGGLVVLTIAAGFFIVGTPFEARLARLDTQKVNDLQNIQWQIVNYWQVKEKLPATLDDLEDPIQGFIVPSDSQSGEEYTYRVKGALTFELCAVFNRESIGAVAGTAPIARPIAVGKPIGIEGNENWAHGERETCFERTIDPELYPPVERKL